MTLSTVSIGMTVFNAEAYLGQTLESLASQTFQNIEFCISDNASTDSSEEICRDFAQRDSRVRYFRQTANQGSIRNWNNALNMATGDYFMWASDHDLWDPTSVEQYVGHLDSCSSTALVHSDARMIDSNGLEVASPADTSIKTVDESRTEGFRRILWNLKRCNAIHGMFSRSIL